MAEQTTERTQVDAPPERCFDIATDFERYPDWAGDIKEVTVLERDDDGRARRVQYRAAAMGRSVTYTLDYDYSKAPESFSWTLVEGDLLRRLDGSYRFEPADGGTRVTYDLTADLAFPLPGMVKRRAQSRIVSTALRDLKRVVEAGPTA